MNKKDYGTKKPGQRRNMKNNLVSLEGESEKKAKLWVAKALLQFGTEVRGNKEKREFTLPHYFKCSPPRDNLDQILGCVSLE